MSIPSPTIHIRAASLADWEVLAATRAADSMRPISACRSMMIIAGAV